MHQPEFSSGFVAKPYWSSNFTAVIKQYRNIRSKAICKFFTERDKQHLCCTNGVQTDQEICLAWRCRRGTTLKIEIVSKSELTPWKYAPYLLQSGNSSSQVGHHHHKPRYAIFSITFPKLNWGHRELFWTHSQKIQKETIAGEKCKHFIVRND